MRPANLSRQWRSPGAPGGGRGLGERRGQAPLSLRHDLLDTRGDDLRLLAQVLADRGQIALDATAVLLDRPLDAVAALAQLALELRPGAAHLALEAVARGGATALVALQLTLGLTRVEAAQVMAERAVLVPVGAGLLARDNLVTTVKGLATKYRTRPALERELKRYERRGATARNRFERQVRRARTRFERELRQRRSLVEKTMRQNRRRVSRELSSVRKDFEKQSGTVTARVERLVSDAQGLIS